MAATQSQEARTRSLIDAALEGRLTDSQAEELSTLGPEVARLALLLAARRIAEQDARIAQLQGRLRLAGPASPSTPSGQRPWNTRFTGTIVRPARSTSSRWSPTPWYEQIASEARRSAVLHADESGWRVNGVTHWLWRFANATTCYYLIDRSRGTPALEKFFLDAFDGVLVSDFWAPYDHLLTDDRQCGLAHLLRELGKVDRINSSADWKAFAKQLRRLVRDGIRLRKRADFTPAKYNSRIVRIHLRVWALAHGRSADADAQRLAARLSKHCDQLFTFLDRPEVPYDNNLAERMIRPAVIRRKTCQGNRSEHGAAVQAVLMSIYRTLKLRGHDPIRTLASALTRYLATGQLPSLPVQSTADG